MKSRACTIAVIMTLLLSFPLSAGTNDIHISEQVQPITEYSPSSTFSSRDLWDSIYSDLNTSDIQETVRVLSEDYPSRLWDNTTNTPSAALEGAWQFVIDKIDEDTGGSIQFEFYTEHQTLVAIKNGTNGNLAPILIGGSIASGDNPGANAYAASVAGVLETARLLSGIDMTNDVFFVLTNTVAIDFDDSSGQEGMRALLELLDAQDREPAACIWFSQLLFYSTLVYGDAVTVRTEYTAGFMSSDFLASIGALVSAYSGFNKATFAINQGNIWEHSGGYDAVMYGIPTITLASYYLDYYTNTIYDTWDQSNFHYGALNEATGLAACITAFLGQLGYGEAPELTTTGIITANTTGFIGGQMYTGDTVNMTISWTGAGAMTFRLFYSGVPTLVFQETNTSPIVRSFDVYAPGWYFIEVYNPNLSDASWTCTYSLYHDYDFDTLDDLTEFNLGTDGLSSDTDQDDLDDLSELQLGTLPTDPDFDGDNLKDGIEILIGTSPFDWDSDDDTLSDSEELALGTSPLSNDTDQDGLLDQEEVALGTNPLSPDTDFDTLTDYDEVNYYLTSPIYNDTDFDSMNDGWEIFYSLNPLDASDATDDDDGDTLSNAFEFAIGTSPISNDTDSDSMTDDWEYTFGLDPTSALDANEDLDHDGLVNWREFAAGTLPNVSDCDGDGLSDLFEVVNGLNPWNIDSDGDSLTDYYEVENDLMPLYNDTDYDGILDAFDWAPKEHWFNIVPPISLTVILGGIIIWLWNKRRLYMRGADN